MKSHKLSRSARRGNMRSRRGITVAKRRSRNGHPIRTEPLIRGTDAWQQHRRYGSDWRLSTQDIEALTPWPLRALGRLISWIWQALTFWRRKPKPEIVLHVTRN